MDFEAALFDMDGVIVDSEPLHVAAFQAALGRYGYELSEEHYKRHFAGKTDEAGFRAYFDFIGETVEVPVVMDQKAKAYLELAADRLELYSGVIESLKYLAEQHKKLALVTGSLRAEVDVVLQTLGLAKYFPATVAAEDVTHSKPHPEGYLKAAKLLHVAAERCLVIEDSPSGLAAAHAASMRSIAVTNTHSASELSTATKLVDQLAPAAFATTQTSAFRD